jgi:predicted membrane channel-forming protein YqfA (hemolysin III family)
MMMIISIFYAWILFVTWSWKEDQIKKAWNIIKSVFLVAIVVLMFLLIIYQIFSEIS